MDEQNSEDPSAGPDQVDQTGAPDSSQQEGGSGGVAAPLGSDLGAPGAAIPPKKEANMKSEIEKAQAERDGYIEDLKRLKAEFENYRKRILREQTEVVSRASAGVVGNLLSVLDNFDLAVSAAEETKDFDKMLRGVEMVYGELKEVLKSEGLELIDAKGKTFDPSLHEAAVETPGDEEGNLIVTEILRPGYMFKGRVLRPAMVRVTRKASGS